MSPPDNTPLRESPTLGALPDELLCRIARHLFDGPALAFAGVSRRLGRALHRDVVLPIRLAASIPWLFMPASFRQAVEQTLLTPTRCWPRLIAMLDWHGALMRLDAQLPPATPPTLAPLEARLAGPRRIEADVECLLNRPYSLRFPGPGTLPQPDRAPSLDDVLALAPRARARVLPRWIKGRRADSPARLPLAQWLAIVGPLPTGDRLRVLRALVWYDFLDSPQARRDAAKVLFDTALAQPTSPGAFDVLLERARHDWSKGSGPFEAIARAAAALPDPQRLLLQSFHAIANGYRRERELQIWDELLAHAAGADEAGAAVLLRGLIWYAQAMRHEDALSRWRPLCDGVMRISPAARGGVMPHLAELGGSLLRRQRTPTQWDPPAGLTPDEMALTVAHLASMMPPSKGVWRQMVDAVIALPERSRFPAVLNMANLMIACSQFASGRGPDVPEVPDGLAMPSLEMDGARFPTGMEPWQTHDLAWPADGEGARRVLSGLLKTVPAEARARLLAAMIDDELGDRMLRCARVLCLVAQCREVPGNDPRLPALVARLARLADMGHGHSAERDAMLVAMLDIVISAAWTEQTSQQWLHLTDAIKGRLSPHGYERLPDMLRALWQQQDNGRAGVGP